MKYLLDTNTCIRYINGRAPKIRERMLAISDSDITISTVTAGEMYVGSAKSQTPEQSRAKQEAFFIRFALVTFDMPAAYEFGRIRAHLEKAGTPIGPFDMQIAAVGVANGLIVVTHNVAEFERIPWLHIEDWEA
ncbi:type II toxin-antitoxin system VapC family toxin [bacterium]|nr:type II toxin-antitoxin system VapC family toxin [bacterium]